jgi:hypothetical protein
MLGYNETKKYKHGKKEEGKGKKSRRKKGRKGGREERRKEERKGGRKEGREEEKRKRKERERSTTGRRNFLHTHVMQRDLWKENTDQLISPVSTVQN